MITCRQDAIKRGHNRYFTGKPCLRGHTAERLVSNRSCLECFNARNRLVYEKNPDKGRQKCKRWRNKNADYNRLRSKVWREKNPEKQADCDRAWQKNNPEKARIKGRRRRANKRNALGTHTADDIKKILTLQGWKCPYCGADLKKIGRHIDHIVPLSRGGGNGPDNLQALCPTCNVTKGAKDPIDFAKSRGFLL